MIELDEANMGRILTLSNLPMALDALRHVDRDDIGRSDGWEDLVSDMIDLRCAVDGHVMHIASLPQGLRQVAVLRYVCGMSQSSIGRIVGCHQSAVHRRLRIVDARLHDMESDAYER